MNKYHNLNSIYQNREDEVFSAMRGTQKCIIKRIKLNQPNKSLRNKQVDMLQSLKSEYIVYMQQVFKLTINTQEYLAIVLEYCSGGNLSEFIGKAVSKKIDTLYKFELMLQMAKGVSFLHSKKVVHRDIKPQNILLHRGNIKIADFGEARNLNDLDQKLTKKIGTYMYLSPQMSDNKRSYSFSVDIWALGIVFIELMSQCSIYNLLDTGHNPAEEVNFPSEELFRKIRRDKFQKLIREMLCKDPNKRIGINGVIKYLNELIHQQQKYYEYKKKTLDIALIEDDKIFKNQSIEPRQDWIFRKECFTIRKCYSFQMKAVCEDKTITDLQLCYDDVVEQIKITVESFEIVYTFNELPLNIKEEFKNIKNLIKILHEKQTKIYYLQSGKLRIMYKFKKLINSQQELTEKQKKLDISIKKQVHNKKGDYDGKRDQTKIKKDNSQSNFKSVEQQERKSEVNKKQKLRKRKIEIVEQKNKKKKQKQVIRPVQNLLLSEQEEKIEQFFRKQCIGEKANVITSVQQIEQYNGVPQDIKGKISVGKEQPKNVFLQNYEKKQTIDEIKQQLLLMENITGPEKILIPWIYTKLAKLLFKNKLYGKALSPLYQSLSRYEEVNYNKSNIYASNLYLLGKSLVKLGNVPLGFDFFQESLDLYMKIDGSDEIGKFKVLNEMGKIYLSKKQVQLAFQKFQAALQKFHHFVCDINAEYLKYKVQPLINMGVILVLKRQYKKAYQYFEQALSIFQMYPSEERIYPLKYITMLLFLTDKYKEALNKFQECLIFITNTKLLSEIKQQMKPFLQIFVVKACDMDIMTFTEIKQIINTFIPQQESIIQEISQIQSKILSMK